MNTSPTECLAQALINIDSATCEAFAHHLPRLIVYAHRHAARYAESTIVPGCDSQHVFYTDQAEYANLLLAQLRLKNAQSLIMELAWIYRSQMLRGITLRGFPIDLATWARAADRYLDPSSAARIKHVYRCLGALHSRLALLAYSPQDALIIDEQLDLYFHRYVAALLKPDMTAAIRITDEYVKTPSQLSIWWEQIIQPAMYEIGHRWASGQITVGQEHLATAITQRVMAHYYPMILDLPRQKGTIVVTASPGELHEIGVRIVADLFEVGGWNVHCTGANTPAQSITDLVQQTNARVLCISTTLATSLPAVSELIDQVRSDCQSAAPHILVGGQAYMSDPNLWQQVGADSFALSARDGIDYIEAYQQN